MSDYGLGRLPAPDMRDNAHPFLRALDPTPPPRISRFWIPTGVLDQNGFPQCVGYAWANWLRCVPTRTLTGPTPERIYDEAQLVDEWPGQDYAGTSVRAGAKFLQAQGRIGEYLWADTAETVRRWLLTRGPVVLGTNWYEGMFTPDAGVVTLTGALAGGHAYLCLGYSEKRRAFRCMNSWGPRWGQRGRFWIWEADLEHLLRENGEACAAVETKPA